MTTRSNSNSDIMAVLLKDARVGTFTGLVTTKVGAVRGGVTYGNDQVHTVVFTGFRYNRLVQRSLDALQGMTNTDILAKASAKGKTLDAPSVAAARDELVASFKATLAETNTSTTDHVYEPLTWDGEPVRGGRVYKCVIGKVNPETGKPYECHCRDCTGDPKAPKSGTIYIQGLRVWNEVLVPAPNGPIPAPKSSPKTVAKDFIRSCLPISKYVSYRLEPGTDFLLRVGGTAAVEATKKGFLVTEDLMQAIDRAA